MIIRHDYHCNDCNEDFEIEQKTQADTRIEICPKCKNKNVEKIYNDAPGFSLKPGGVGWSDTGYSK